jgi:hypothetical protein
MSLPCINVMPHRAWARAQARRRLCQALAVLSAVAAASLGLAHWGLQSRLQSEQVRLDAQRRAWALAQAQAQQRRRTEQTLAQDAQVREQQHALWARQRDVVRWWSGAALALPPGAYLTQLQWTKGEVSVVVRGQRDEDALAMQQGLRLPAARWSSFELLELGEVTSGAQRAAPQAVQQDAAAARRGKRWVMRARAVEGGAP